MSKLSDLLAKAKAWLVAEATKVEDAISPVVHSVAHSILNTVEVDAATIGAQAMADHNDGKSTEEILNNAKNAVVSQFASQGKQLLEDAGVAAAKAIVAAHITVAPGGPYNN